jgi:protein-disulfide isomerase
LTDKVTPGRGSSRDTRPPPEADLDAALWPAPSGPTTEPVPISSAPARRPARISALPDGLSPPGQATSLSLAAPSTERHPSPPDNLAEVAPPVHTGTRRATTIKTPGMAARERLRQERARRDRRKRRLRVAAVGAGAVSLIAAATIGILVQHNGATVKTRAGNAVRYAPVTLNGDNSVTMAQPGVTKPVLDVYEDFQCAECRAFEKGNGGVIQKLAAQGKVRVLYHPFTIFSGQLQQASSIRAWAAAKCVPANLWVRYHNALYASQSAGTTANGFPISLLVRLGKKVGVASADFVQCVQSQKYAAQNPPLSNQIINSGVNGAPILMLNGKVLNIKPLSSTLRQQILSASK